MNALTIFEDRKEDFHRRIESSEGAKARREAAVLIIEEIACILAQEETDDVARQRQQAVLALMKQSPSLLDAARAEGELVIMPSAPVQATKKGLLNAKNAGLALLALLAAYELIDGQFIFALLQAAGCALMLFGGGMLGTLAAHSPRAQARGVLDVDNQALLERIGALCRAADMCVSDLTIIEKEASLSRLSGTADEATLDLLTAMLEAKASGRNDAAVRTLNLAEQYLTMLGVEPLYYSEETAAYFDVLPSRSGERTIRPALLKDGGILRRGVAVKAMERSMSV